MPIVPFAGPTAAKGALVPLGSVKYTSPSTGVGFSLPSSTSGFQDLYLVCSLRNEVAGAGLVFYFNGDVGSGNYSFSWIIGDGASASSGRQTNQNYLTWYQTASASDAPGVFSTHVFHIINPRPSATSPFRTVLYQGANEKNSNSGSTFSMALTWRGAAAMQAVTVGATGGNFSAGSTFNLYGVRSIGQ